MCVCVCVCANAKCLKKAKIENVCVCANARERRLQKGQDIECVCAVSKKLILFCMKLLHMKCEIKHEIKRTERPF